MLDDLSVFDDQTKRERPSRMQIGDSFLAELSDELGEALQACHEHHKTLIEYTKMMDKFVRNFVLVKSFQFTFQLCNLAVTVTHVCHLNSRVF